MVHICIRTTSYTNDWVTFSMLSFEVKSAMAWLTISVGFLFLLELGFEWLELLFGSIVVPSKVELVSVGWAFSGFCVSINGEFEEPFAFWMYSLWWLFFSALLADMGITSRSACPMLSRRWALPLTLLTNVTAWVESPEIDVNYTS